MPQNSRPTRTVKETPVSSAVTEFGSELRVFEQNKPKWLTEHASKLVVFFHTLVEGFPRRGRGDRDRLRRPHAPFPFALRAEPARARPAAARRSRRKTR